MTNRNEGKGRRRREAQGRNGLSAKRGEGEVTAAGGERRMRSEGGKASGMKGQNSVSVKSETERNEAVEGYEL